MAFRSSGSLYVTSPANRNGRKDRKADIYRDNLHREEKKNKLKHSINQTRKNFSISLFSPRTSVHRRPFRKTTYVNNDSLFISVQK